MLGRLNHQFQEQKRIPAILAQNKIAVEGLNFDEKVAEVVATKDAISNTDRKKNTQAWNEEATEMGMKKCNYGTTDLVVI